MFREKTHHNTVTQTNNTSTWRGKIVSHMTRSINELPNKADSENNIHNINEFYSIGEKTIGKSPGIIAKKKNISNNKPENNKSGKKYHYEWIIKKQSPKDTIADVIGAEIVRFFLGDRAPKNRLIKETDIEGNVYIYTASRVIEKFYPLHFACNFQQNYKIPLSAEYYLFYKRILEAYKVMAINLFIGNFDVHSNNIGLVDKNRFPGGAQAACIDFGYALNFIKPINPHDQAIIFSLNCNKMLHPVTFEIKAGEKFTPANILRLLHNHHYQINSPIFLNQCFIEALRSLTEQIKYGGYKLETILRSVTKHIITHFPAKDIEAIGKRIAPNTNVKNFTNNIINSLYERAEMLQEFALDIELQLSLIQQDNKKFKELLKKYPHLIHKEFEWLANDDKEIYQPKSNLITYIWHKKFHSSYLILKEEVEKVGRRLLYILPNLNPEFIHHQQFRAEMINLVNNSYNKDLVQTLLKDHFFKNPAELKVFLYEDTTPHYQKLIKNIANHVNPHRFYCILTSLEKELKCYNIEIIKFYNKNTREDDIHNYKYFSKDELKSSLAKTLKTQQFNSSYLQRGYTR